MNPFERGFDVYRTGIMQRALEAFRDDLGAGDITTEAVLTENPIARAEIIAEEDCVLAGVLEARAIFEKGKLTVTGKTDGDAVKTGQKILKLEGPIGEILSRERVSLNYLSRMSGIATISRELYNKHGPRVLFLRKTDPGLLLSEKRAVALGGCLPHRINLSDGILIKDNHINQLAEKLGRKKAIRLAISRADEHIGKQQPKKRQMPIEIEVESVQEAEIAAREFREIGGIDIIMLDNMGLAEVKKSAKAIKSISKNIIIEASGGITNENIGDYLRAGADYVSTSLFMAARPCKFKLELSP